MPSSAADRQGKETEGAGKTGRKGTAGGVGDGGAVRGRLISRKKRTVNVQVGGGRAATTFRRYKSARRWRHLWEETKPMALCE